MTLEKGDGTSEVIESTTSHPFRVRGEGWVKVGELTPGSRVVDAGGAELLVTRIAFTTRSEPVYNFGVEEFRSYFVGESGAWVHNCWVDEVLSEPTKISGKSADEIADDLRSQGIEATVEQSTRGSRRSKKVMIDTNNSPLEMIQVHPGGGRHGGSYVKVSTDRGTYKVVDPDTYQGGANENATIFSKHDGSIVHEGNFSPE